ncbi:hypothetical protein SAMN05444411_105134 [Lutibacter oricola]|uniref:Uncharacterized protein n=1 Tax=Lutibacter oricola TaxID=762486 RepID=A0A1H3BL91_9FLAO|nr:hypothetical protein [Lutibacter oricola]SDX41869.1 hypothetical protein SAMN05444411_105134 [Lutibacter oricola]
MKKILLTLVVLFTITASFGQNKWQQKQISYFVDAAVKEYSLNEDQKTELNEIRTTVIMAYINGAKKVKSGELTKNENKEITKKASNVFNKKFGKMIGKNYKEFSPFLQKIAKEIKDL